MSSGYPVEWTRGANRQMIHRLISNARGKNSIKFELWPVGREKKSIIRLIVCARGLNLSIKFEIKTSVSFLFFFWSQTRYVKFPARMTCYNFHIRSTKNFEYKLHTEKIPYLIQNIALLCLSIIVVIVNVIVNDLAIKTWRADIFIRKFARKSDTFYGEKNWPFYETTVKRFVNIKYTKTKLSPIPSKFLR